MIEQQLKMYLFILLTLMTHSLINDHNESVMNLVMDRQQKFIFFFRWRVSVTLYGIFRLKQKILILKQNFFTKNRFHLSLFQFLI